MATTKTNLIITARASQALVSPRKANLLLESLVGKSAVEVIKMLPVITKRASDPVLKLVKQAVGNAVSQHQLSPDSLIIDSAFATKGRVLKRAHIGGRGKTKPYEKTASHLTLNLRVKTTSAPTPKSTPKVEAIKTEVAKAPKAKATIKKNTK
jgi:large subunit ribosomal protein L22